MHNRAYLFCVPPLFLWCLVGPFVYCTLGPSFFSTVIISYLWMLKKTGLICIHDPSTSHFFPFIFFVFKDSYPLLPLTRPVFLPFFLARGRSCSSPVLLGGLSLLTFPFLLHSLAHSITSPLISSRVMPAVFSAFDCCGIVICIPPHFSLFFARLSLDFSRSALWFVFFYFPVVACRFFFFFFSFFF